MPACFQLIPKGTSEPAILQRIDDAMREHFGVAPDSTNWLSGWYESIGLRMACGKSYGQIREEFQGYLSTDDSGEKRFYRDLLDILGYLEERYETNSFYSSVR